MFHANIEGDGRGNLAILKHGHLKIIEVLMNIGSINEKARVGVFTKESCLVTFEARIRQQIGNVRDAFVIGRVGCCGTNEEGLCCHEGFDNWRWHKRKAKKVHRISFHLRCHKLLFLRHWCIAPG